MPALHGYDEHEAATLVLEFLAELAVSLENEYRQFHGLFRKFQFRGTYTNFAVLAGKATEGPPTMTSCFKIEVRGRALRPYLDADSLQAQIFPSREWMTFAAMTLHRIDWDDTPEMQSGTCTWYFPELTPDWASKKLEKFLKVMFGCGRVAYFDASDIEIALLS